MSRALGNAEFAKDLHILTRVISILIYPFVRDVSTIFPFVCTSPAKAPFPSPHT